MTNITGASQACWPALLRPRRLPLFVLASLMVLFVKNEAAPVPPPESKSAAESLDILLDALFESGGAWAEDGHPNLGKVPKADLNLTLEEKRGRMLVCFEATQRHLANNNEAYSNAAEMAGTTKGMRDQDAIRLFFHGSVVACYENIDSKDVQRFKSGSLKDSDLKRILWRDETTPHYMSKEQYKILGDLAAEFQSYNDAQKSRDSNMSWLTLSGTPGFVYLCGTLTLITAVLFFAVMRLVRFQQLNKRKKLIKKEKSANRSGHAAGDKKKHR